MFEFIERDYMTDKEIDLIIDSKNPENKEKDYVPSYYYIIKEHGKDKVIGRIDLRVGDNDNTYFGGHIGYSIDEEFRGNRYATKACLLICQLAKEHGMKEVIITCSPDNIASRKTCERAGARFIEIVDLPEYNEMYQQGERQKCRYQIQLN